MNPAPIGPEMLLRLGYTGSEINHGCYGEPGPWYIDFQSRLAERPTRSTRDMTLEENLLDRSWAQ